MKHLFRTVGMLATILLVVTGLLGLSGCQSVTYTVRVVDPQGNPVDDAEVTIDVQGKYLTGYTNESGQTTIRMEKKHINANGLLIVRARNYQEYFQNIAYVDQLPSQVVLEPQTPSPVTGEIGGQWKGVIRQASGEETLVECSLEQVNAQISGIRSVDDATSPYYGIVNVKGTVAGSTLTLEETEVIREYPHSDVMCFLKCSLEVTTSSEGVAVLKGPCESSPAQEDGVESVCGAVGMWLKQPMASGEE